MPHLDPLPDDQLGAAKPALDAMGAALGYVPNSVKTLARKPEIAQALSGLAMSVMAPGTVDPQLKNLLAQVVSRSAGCSYCAAHTGHASHNVGISSEKEDALWDWERSPLFSEAEKAALTVAQGAAQVPNGVTAADFTALKKHFDDTQIVEIVAVISLFGFFNRFNDTMATQLEDIPRTFGQETLAPGGWTVGKHA